MPPPPPIVEEPTGLSDEEDAVRHLRRKFDDLVGFCPNCESYYAMPNRDFADLNEVIFGTMCPICRDFLYRVGHPPLRRKYNP